MDRFQIIEVTEQQNHAGSKATADISEIAETLRFKKLVLQMRTTKEGVVAKLHRQLGYLKDWNHCYNSITYGSVLLLQHPFHYPQITREKLLYKLKNEKKVKIISIVHDVEELRAFRFNDYYQREFQVMLDIADVIIVHNEVMKKFFLDRGVREDRLVILEIFDYLQNERQNNPVKFERSITIAGNLDTTKCQYIGQLGTLKGIKVNLYGPNFNRSMSQYDNIVYHGSFPADTIPSKLNAGFGLVWDGESIDGCQGLSGQYLKYNNPHKLSLYLSSGLPVVIWNGAAEAEFVKKNGVGICIDKLDDLGKTFDEMDLEKYKNMLANIQRIQSALINGQYAKCAIDCALKRI